MAMKSTSVVGLFHSREAAENAVLELQRAGFPDRSIGMVVRNSDGTMETDLNGETKAEEGLAIGAVTGAGAGALVGLGVVSGVIPVVGPVLAIGALGTILLNAAAGAAVAGLVGALVGLGIPEEDARFYENEVRSGRFLVTVNDTDRSDEAWTILRRAGAYNRSTPPAPPPGSTSVPPVYGDQPPISIPR